MKIIDNVWRSFAFIIAVSLASPTVHAEIKIGIAGPLSGSAMATGEQSDFGAQKAISDLNNNGGLLGQEIDFISVDDACEPNQAEAVARQLVSEGVIFVVGHVCSGASIAAMGVYEEAGIIMMSPASTNPKVTDEGGSNIFRVIGRDDQQGTVAGDYLADNHTSSKIAIIHDGEAYGSGLAEFTKRQLNKRGVTEVMYEPYTGEQDEYTALVSKLQTEGIDVLYAGGYQDDIALIIRQAKETIPNLKLISGDSLVSADFIVISGEAGEGTYFTFGPDVRSKPEAASVVEAFREEDAFEPDGFTLYSYGAVQAWSQAVKQAESFESEAVIAALQTGSFDTVLGKIGFDDKGDVTGVENFIWYVFEEDKYVPAE